MQNPLTCRSEWAAPQRHDEESRILPENQPRIETLRSTQSDIILICIQTLVIYQTSDRILE